MHARRQFSACEPVGGHRRRAAGRVAGSRQAFVVPTPLLRSDFHIMWLVLQVSPCFRSGIAKRSERMISLAFQRFIMLRPLHRQTCANHGQRRPSYQIQRGACERCHLKKAMLRLETRPERIILARPIIFPAASGPIRCRSRAIW